MFEYLPDGSFNYPHDTNMPLLTGNSSDESMNRMRKFVSPRFRHKVLETPNKTFGVPLDELVRQAPAEGDSVPTAVKKICEHIHKHGMKEVMCSFIPVSYTHLTLPTTASV